jgi:hypothetical protein
MNVVQKIQRALLAGFALWAGSFALASLLAPRAILARAIGAAVTGPSSTLMVLGGGMRLGLALVAGIAAFSPKPPRPLVGAIAIALVAELIGVVFNRALGTMNPVELKPFMTWIWIDALFALALGGTAIARRILRAP